MQTDMTGFDPQLAALGGAAGVLGLGAPPSTGAGLVDQPDDKAPQVEATPANPQPVSGKEQIAAEGLTDEDWNILIDEIITPYRTEWAPNRLLQLPRWIKAAEYDKGNQNLAWDPVSKQYFDAVAWYRQNGGEEDVTYLEKYTNNITRMLRRSYVASVARGVPPVVVRPENAENLNDSTTAKASQQAISIIERMNRALALTRNISHKLFLYGCCFRRTRFVIDGQWAGTREVPVPAEKQVVFPGHFHCRNCGKDTPETMAAQNCDCGRDFAERDYYPPQGMTVPTVTMTQQSRGMVKWSTYSPLQIDTDPTAKSLAQVPLLALDMETDVADLRATFPEDADKIVEGMQSITDPNNEYARLLRTKVYSQAGGTNTIDPMRSRSTFTQVWVQPRTYYKSTNKDFIAKMQRLFPKGVKLSLTGDVRLKAEQAELLKEFTHVGLDEEYGLYPPSIADVVVPFNERFNNSENVTDDWFERCAAGMVVFDTNSIDPRQMDGKQMQPGVMTGLPTIGSGQQRPLEDSIVQFSFQFEAAMFTYQDRLMSLVQLLACISPQVFGGGTQKGVETAKGQQQMLEQALGILGIDWALIKEEAAAAAQLAIECLIRNKELCGDIWDVIEERGSEFRNNYVHLNELQGKVRVYEQVDEGLPLTAEQKRAWWQNALDNAKDNPVYQQMMDDPTNQETAAAATGVTDLVVPKSAARSKTLQDIYKLFQSKPLPQMDPRTNQQARDNEGELQWSPSFAPDKWMEDYVELKATMLQYGQENCDLKQDNPTGWLNFIAYYRLACQYEVEVESFHAVNKLKIQQAGQPQPPAPPPVDPVLAQAKRDLLERATRAVDRDAELSELPPLGKNQSISGQVTATGKILDTALKLVTDKVQ
jgi:hypothetical protein